MAILEQPVYADRPFADVVGDSLAPEGTHIAEILDIQDDFGVRRKKYQSEEIETVDLTCFLFGFRDAAGTLHQVTSKQMRISGNEKSNLYGFLKMILGKAPAYGWDYCALKGRKVLLTVEHIPRRTGDGVYAAIASLSPVPSGLAAGKSEVGGQKSEAVVEGSGSGTAAPTVDGEDLPY